MKISYKLVMIRFPINRTEKMTGENENMVTSCYIPSITLNKRHTCISYNRVREDLDAGVISLTHITGRYNAYDIMTKPLDAVTGPESGSLGVSFLPAYWQVRVLGTSGRLSVGTITLSGFMDRCCH